MTRQRRVILEVLEKLNSHPTADEVYEAVRERLPRISLSTVYHNLELLCDRGMIQMLEVGCSKKHFDCDTRDHYHVRCARCGRVENLPIEPFSYLERALRHLSDYEVTGHKLELIGICPQCRQKEAEEDSSSDAEAAREDGEERRRRS